MSTEIRNIVIPSQYIS